ncbi:unnamed protein product [Brassica oleracea]|uniref:Uncharacterized protein n=1 Tax=Brassica oleracea var. oleracea TaxID=109376 RepID=A0A0D3BDE5_BRAOL
MYTTLNVVPNCPVKLQFRLVWAEIQNGLLGLSGHYHTNLNLLCFQTRVQFEASVNP